MPEGDVVWRAARQMHRALAGQVVTGSDLRVPQHATADLSDTAVREVVSRGKHLLHRFEGLDSSPPVTLHTHLKMEGEWQLYRPGQRWRRPAHQARVVLATPTCQAVGFSLGVCELLPTSEEGRVVGHLGPDLLGPDWTADEAVRRIRGEVDRTLAEALLDQRNLAGIGTLYRSEVLFLRGLHPSRPVGEIADLTAVVTLAHRLLFANRDRVGQSTTGSTRRGEQHWVYKRAGRPCLRCRTMVEHDVIGPATQERGVFWCPRCQRA